MMRFFTKLRPSGVVSDTTAQPTVSPEKFLQHLEWTTLRRLDGQLQGDYRTWFKGSGLELADLREYQTHDDVRHIDWNVTARMQTPYVREHQEDREMTAWFLVDLSRSNDFGSQQQSKRTLAASFVGTMARLLSRRGNRVGAMLMTGSLHQVDSIVPAKTGKAHIIHLLHQLLSPAPAALVSAQRTVTDLKVLLHTAKTLIPRRSTVFVVSDFISQPHWEKSLGELGKSHEVIAIRLSDPLETTMQELGLCVLEDLETGEQLFVDANEKQFLQNYNRFAQEQELQLRSIFSRTGTDCLELTTTEPLEDALLRFIRLRKRKTVRVASHRQVA